jgi:hypothetical protein
MKIISFRLLSATFGLVAGLLAVGGPIIILSHDLHGVDLGVVGGWVCVLLIAGLFAFTSFVSLRYSVLGPEHGPSNTIRQPRPYRPYRPYRPSRHTYR